jgi:hypothetical protein
MPGADSDSGSVEYACSLCEEKFATRAALSIHEILGCSETGQLSGDTVVGLKRGDDAAWNYVGRCMP